MRTLIFLMILLLPALPARAETLPAPDLARLLARLQPAPALAVYAVRELGDAGQALIDPDSLHPDWSHVPLPALQGLWRLSGDCRAQAPGAPARAVAFERALCAGQVLPPAWFAAGAPVHPLGGSYAMRYRLRHPDARVTPWLHVRERRGELIAGLSDDNLARLAAGHAWLLQDRVLWLNAGAAWRAYAPAVWEPVVREAGWSLMPAGDPACGDDRTDACWVRLSPLARHARWWPVVPAVLLLALLAQRIWLRRRLAREQAFVLQMLTHELRTPIASLTGGVEALRRDFDALPDRLHPVFGRLADDVLRLRRLADASLNYLSAGRGGLDAVCLSAWLDAQAGRHDVTYCLMQDAVLKLPLYWLDLVLDNLLSNACRHGVPPVRLRADVSAHHLRIEVSDGGSLSGADLRGLVRPFRSRGGVGLGLTLADRVMRRLGGRLRLAGPPTSFLIELPLGKGNRIETDAVAGRG